MSIHPALQTISHFRHEMHIFSSILILNIENFEIKPINAPSGQIVLQKILPLVEAKNINTAKKKVVKIMVKRSLFLTSTVKK